MINLVENDEEYNNFCPKVEIKKERLIELELYFEFKKNFDVSIISDKIVIFNNFKSLGEFNLTTSIEDIIKELYKSMKIVKNAEYFKEKYSESLNNLKSQSENFYDMLLLDFENSLKEGKRFYHIHLPNHISSEYILKKLNDNGFYFKEENDFMGNSIIISLFEDEVS
jgi:hypothetical protein